MIFNNKGDGNFTILPNKMIADVKLSFKAKGVLAYLLSKPKNWDVSVEDISKRGTEGKSAIYSAVDELIEAGYVKRVQERKQGKFTQYVYDVYNSPHSGKPYTDNSDTEKPYTENRTQLSTEYNKTDISKDLYMSTKVDDTLKSFLIQLIGELGFSEQVQVTPKRLAHLKSRLKTYTKEQMSSAAKSVRANDWLQGKNPQGKKYGTIDYLLRSDEQVETLLLDAPSQNKSRIQQLMESQDA